MNAHTSTKTSAHRWVLISAGMLLYANGVLAAAPVGDAQQQARDLILGTVNGQARTIDKLHVVAAAGHSRGNLDPQEQARQMILGRAASAIAIPERSAAMTERRTTNVQ